MARTTIKTSIIAIITILFSLVWCSCTEDTLQHQYQHIDKGGWQRNDLLVYEIPPAKEKGLHSLVIEMRTTADFNHKRLCIAVDFITPPPYKHISDTVCISTDNGNGKLGGDGIVLRCFYSAAPNLFLHEGQSGQITLRQVMEEEPIKGITDIGIKVRAIR
jgi:gliding motility-associated lipoprotein GldH